MAVREDDLGSVEQDLTILIRRARALMNDAAKDISSDLDAKSYALLIRIAEQGNVRSSDLASFFGVGKPTMGRQLMALERAGLIERAVEAGDGRSQPVRLTADTSAKLSAVRGERSRRFRNAVDAWSDEELAELARSLRRLNQLQL